MLILFFKLIMAELWCGGIVTLLGGSFTFGISNLVSMLFFHGVLVTVY